MHLHPFEINELGIYESNASYAFTDLRCRRTLLFVNFAVYLYFILSFYVRTSISIYFYILKLLRVYAQADVYEEQCVLPTRIIFRFSCGSDGITITF